MTAKTPLDRSSASLCIRWRQEDTDRQEAAAYALPAIAAAQTAIRAALNTVPPDRLAAHMAALTPAARAARETLADASRRLSAAAAVLSGGSVKAAEAELILARRFGTH